MRALKALRSGAVGPFSGFRWPTPGDGPGAWVEAEAGLSPCASGIHACLPAQLPAWLQDELWEIELGGEITMLERKVVGERGRLLRRVDEWDERVLAEYGEACLRRVEALASENERLGVYAADGPVLLAHGEELLVAFSAARAAEVAGGSEGYDRERAWQAAWLAERLGLDAAVV